MGLAVPPERHRVALSPINRRRWQNFKANRRGYVAFWIFLVLFVVTLFAEFLANDKPFLIRIEGKTYVPVLFTYPETAFGGEFETAADYRDPYLQQADRGEGRLDLVAADPLLLFDTQSQPADARAVAADLDADRRAMQGRRPRRSAARAARISNTTGSAPTIRAATWWRG